METTVHPDIEKFRILFKSTKAWQYEKRLLYRGGINNLNSAMEQAKQIIKQNNLNLQVTNLTSILSPHGTACFAVDVIEKA